MNIRTIASTAALLAAVWCAQAQQDPEERQLELKTIFDGKENLALEKPPFDSGGAGQGHAGLLTDGDTASDPYLGGPTRVGVDFEETITVNGIRIWHYWADLRTYEGNIIALSESLGFNDVNNDDKDRLDEIDELTVVYNTNAGDPTYPERADGWMIAFDPIQARYLHAWVGGSNANIWSHWVEIQAFYIPELLSVDPEGKAAATWGGLKTR